MRRNQVALPGGHDDDLRQRRVRARVEVDEPVPGRAQRGRHRAIGPAAAACRLRDPVVGAHQADAEHDGTAAAATARAPTVATRACAGGDGGRRAPPGTATGSRSEPRHRRRLLVLLALGQAAGDARPQPLGQGLHRVAHGRRHLAQAVELGPAARAGLQMLLELGELVAVDGIEGVGTQELARLVVGHHASTPRTPASARTARMRRMPLRIRLLTVPSGWSSSCATSR